MLFCVDTTDFHYTINKHSSKYLLFLFRKKESQGCNGIRVSKLYILGKLSFLFYGRENIFLKTNMLIKRQIKFQFTIRKQFVC